MQQLTIQAYHRTKLHGNNPRKIVSKGYVPGVLYGGNNAPTIHLYLPASSLQPLNYAPYFITLQLQGKEHVCILQDKQINPVSGIPIHIDFLRITQDKPITMHIPVKLVGKAVGVSKGGLLVKKIRKLETKALPQHMPEHITLDVSTLDLGQGIQVKKTPTHNFVLLDNPTSRVVTVDIPRALRSKANQAEEKTT